MTIQATDGGATTAPASYNGAQDASAPELVKRGAIGPTQGADSSVVLELPEAPVPSVSQLPAPTVPLGPNGVVAGTAANLGEIGATEAAADIYALMALLQQTAQSQRLAAREVRYAEMQQQVTDLLDAAQDMRDSAQKRMVGAIVAGSLQIVGGVVSGLSASGLSVKGVKFNNPELGRAASGTFGGIGDTVKASMEVQATDFDAEKSEREAAARMHENSAQQAQEQAQQMLDVMRDIREKLGAIEQSRQETNRGIARSL